MKLFVLGNLTKAAMLQAVIRGIAIQVRGCCSPKISLVGTSSEYRARLRCIGHEQSLFIGKLGSNEVCLSANWAPTKFVCRQIGLERRLFVGKLGLCIPPTISSIFALAFLTIILLDNS